MLVFASAIYFPIYYWCLSIIHVRLVPSYAFEQFTIYLHILFCILISGTIYTKNCPNVTNLLKTHLRTRFNLFLFICQNDLFWKKQKLRMKNQRSSQATLQAVSRANFCSILFFLFLLCFIKKFRFRIHVILKSFFPNCNQFFPFPFNIHNSIRFLRCCTVSFFGIKLCFKDMIKLQKCC